LGKHSGSSKARITQYVPPIPEQIPKHNDALIMSERLTADNNHIPNSRFVKLNHANSKKERRKNS
jgi:hypothetical protein